MTEVDPNVIAAILAVVTGGLGIAVTELLKRLLQKVFNMDTLGPMVNMILTGLVVFGATAYYLLTITHSFTWGAFALYGVVAFMQATGLYKVVTKPT